MIEIRLTGTQDELNQAMTVTRNGYKILAKTKPQQMPNNPLQWSIHIRAEFKPIGAELPPSPAKAALTGQDTPHNTASIS